MTHRIARTAVVALVASLVIAGGPAAEATTPKAVWGAVGNSITFGTGTSDPATKAYPVVAGVPAIGLPAQMLTEAFVWPPLTETFEGEIADLQASDDVNAVVVEIGINDLHLHKSDSTIIKAFRKVVGIGHDDGFRVVLATITPFGPSFDATATMKSQRIRINTWIRGRAYYVDFAKALGGKVMKAEYDSGDGLHPGDVGAARLGSVLKAWVAAHPNGLPS